MMENLRNSVQDVIQDLESLVVTDPRRLYQDVLERYTQALSLIKRQAPISEIRKEIANTTRIMMDTPTKDRETGLTILRKIDSIYKQIENLEG